MHFGFIPMTLYATLRYYTVYKLRGTLSISIYFELGGLKVAKKICQVVLFRDGD